MNSETKKLLLIGLVALVLIGGSLLVFTVSPKENTEVKRTTGTLVRETSHKTAAGPVASAVTIVEFGDYQCPACAFAHPIVKKLVGDYAGNINLVYRHFPLSQHRHALIAAEAAEAAGAQGKFWEMHNRLYEDQKRWSASDKPLDIFMEYAKEFGLDTEKFKKSVENSAFLEVIKIDQKDATDIGISATPTLFINGEQYADQLSYDALQDKVDFFLKKKSSAKVK